MFDGDYFFQMVFAGMMFSSSIWGSICDKYGRKSVSILSLYIFSISSGSVLVAKMKTMPRDRNTSFYRNVDSISPYSTKCSML